MEGMDDDVTVRLDPDERPAAETRLLAAAWRYDRAERSVAPWAEDFKELRAWVGPLLRPAARVSRRFRFLLGREARDRGLAALQELDARLADERAVRLGDDIAASRRILAESTPGDDELWRDYERRSVEVNMLLAAVARADADEAREEARADAARGYVPAELADRVRRHPLDTSLMKASLRGYQAFGAKFALSQRRAILGDEMGLGKTIEAIAALAHLRAGGATHFLTVCPASVLVNWMQEVAKHSELTTHRIHGPERDGALARWVDEGGLGVTTYETLRAMEPPDGLDLDMIVVDEAHFVKNPDTQRSQAVRRWMELADRALFLTGTPMENRVDEFRTLVDYLQPDVAAAIGDSDGLAGAKAFRRHVAPAYLRRNQDDVLSELPERLDQLDWVELTPADLDAYREAVASDNFMAMRRATFVGDGRRPSAKLERLAEILDEAADNGRKVVVFSYFRATLDVVCSMVGEAVHGPLDGSTPAEDRQKMVDEFTAVDGHAVLVSQIQAGGVGLNMQAASVVVLTEPQWKPSAEEQAIARCHRMGQVRRVHVHRLLAEDSVDQRMLEMLAEKGALMDAYVRESDLKDASVDAVDASSHGAPDDERRIVAGERARLGLAS
jgi:SNF2 family DNA or RNA helicase